MDRSAKGRTRVYIRQIYWDIFYESINFCQREKGLEVYAYCVMTSHIHMIIGRNGSHDLSNIIRDFAIGMALPKKLYLKAYQKSNRKQYAGK